MSKLPEYQTNNFKRNCNVSEVGVDGSTVLKCYCEN